MIIKENIYHDHPENTSYEFVVTTDSSLERDMIHKYLVQAKAEFRKYLKKQTKCAPEVPVLFSASISGANDFKTSKALYSYAQCPCGQTIFFNKPDLSYFSIECPACDHKQVLMREEV